MFWRRSNTAVSGAGPVAAERRRGPRHETAVLTCQLGQVIDLSAGGMRVRCRGKPLIEPGQAARFVVQSPLHQVNVAARAVRVSKLGGGWFEIGLAFVGLAPAAAAAIEGLAQFGFVPGADRAGGGVSVGVSVPTRDHYGVLGVERAAEPAAIRRAYHDLARRYHPDMNREPGAERRFIEINEAYTVLKDPEARVRFDAMTG